LSNTATVTKESEKAAKRTDRKGRTQNTTGGTKRDKQEERKYKDSESSSKHSLSLSHAHIHIQTRQQRGTTQTDSSQPTQSVSNSLSRPSSHRYGKKQQCPTQHLEDTADKRLAQLSGSQAGAMANTTPGRHSRQETSHQDNNR
jgi:hypothetical protein